jgi:xanthine dehydrogenase small subunit
MDSVAFLSRCRDLKDIVETDTEIRFGAMTTLTEVETAIAPH